MSLTVLNYLVFIGSSFAVARTVYNFRTDKSSLRSSILWIFLWTSIGVVSIVPNLLDYILIVVKWQRRLNIALVIAVIILFALLFKLSSQIDRIEREASRSIQESALLNYKIKYKLQEKNNTDKTH